MGDIIRLVRKGRLIGWYVRYVDTDGKRKQRASHQPTQALARRFLLEIEARVARGNVGIPEPVKAAPTIAELAARFVTEYSRPRIKDIVQYRAHASTNLRRTFPYIGQRAADTLTSDDIAALRDKLAVRFSAASVRASLAYLSTLYLWAGRLKLVSASPLRGVERPIAALSIDYFSKEETAAFLRLASAGANRMLSCCVHLAVHTGLRKGELLGLRWQDLDLDTQRMTVARSYNKLPKSGKARQLRLPPACVPMLREWRPICPVTPEGVVFPLDRGGNHPTHAMLGLPALLKKAGVRCPAHPWHAMRHTFASHYIMQGGNILALQRILGHSDVKMTMIYAHLAPDFLGNEMARVKF